MPFSFKSPKAPLTEYLICRDRHGIAQIQASEVLAHRYPHAPVKMLVKQILGKTRRLLAENKKHLFRIGHIAVCIAALCGEKEAVFRTVCICKFGKRSVICDIELIPVIEPRAFEFFIVDLKAHRLDYVQRHTRRRTGPRDIAGILRYLRLHQNNINVSHSYII